MNKMFYIMKKILLTIITLFSITALNATTADSLQISNEKLQKEILSIRVDCALKFLDMELDNLSSHLEYNINNIRIYTVDKEHKMNYVLFDLFIKLYQSNYNLYEAYQEKIIAYKKQITEIINTGIFSENEITLFENCLETIDKRNKALISTFDLYKETIIAYENKKK